MSACSSCQREARSFLNCLVESLAWYRRGNEVLTIREHSDGVLYRSLRDTLDCWKLEPDIHSSYMSPSKASCSLPTLNPVQLGQYTGTALFPTSYLLLYLILYTSILFFLLYAVFFFPMLVSMLPKTHVTANTVNMPSVMTTGFLYPAVHG